MLLTLAPAVAQTLGRSDPSFSQPSRAPGVDYVLPTEGEVLIQRDPHEHLILAVVEPHVHGLNVNQGQIGRAHV